MGKGERGVGSTVHVFSLTKEELWEGAGLKGWSI